MTTRSGGAARPSSLENSDKRGASQAARSYENIGVN